MSAVAPTVAAPPSSPTPAVSPALVSEVYRRSREIARRRLCTHAELDDALQSAFLLWYEIAARDPATALLHPAGTHAHWVATRAGNLLDPREVRRGRTAARHLAPLAVVAFSEQAYSDGANPASDPRSVGQQRQVREYLSLSRSGDDAEDSVLDALDASRSLFSPPPAASPLTGWRDALASLLRSGWTKAHLGAEVGVCHQAVSGWARGTMTPHPARQVALGNLAASGRAPAGSGRAASLEQRRLREGSPDLRALEDRDAVGRVVRSMLAAGWTTGRLAQVLEVSEKTPCRWARGECRPTPGTRARLLALAGGVAPPDPSVAQVALAGKVGAALRASGGRVAPAARAMGVAKSTLQGQIATLRIRGYLPSQPTEQVQ